MGIGHYRHPICHIARCLLLAAHDVLIDAPKCKTEQDIWKDKIEEYLEDKKVVTLPELCTEVLSIDDVDRASLTKAGAIMANLPGWKKVKASREGRRVYEYQKYA